MESGHKVSTSDHPLFQLALCYTTIFVRISAIYGICLLAAALYPDYLRAIPFVSKFQCIADGDAEDSATVGKASRAAALSLTTAGVMGVLVAAMVSFFMLILTETILHVFSFRCQVFLPAELLPAS